MCNEYACDKNIPTQYMHFSFLSPHQYHGPRHTELSKIFKDLGVCTAPLNEKQFQQLTKALPGCSLKCITAAWMRMWLKDRGNAALEQIGVESRKQLLLYLISDNPKPSELSTIELLPLYHDRFAKFSDPGWYALLHNFSFLNTFFQAFTQATLRQLIICLCVHVHCHGVVLRLSFIQFVGGVQMTKSLQMFVCFSTAATGPLALHTYEIFHQLCASAQCNIFFFLSLSLSPFSQCQTRVPSSVQAPI